MTYITGVKSTINPIFLINLYFMLFDSIKSNQINCLVAKQNNFYTS